MAGMPHSARRRAGPKSNRHDYHATESSGYPTVTKADIARNVADLLNRAHGPDLTPDEAKAVAVDANRPVRPQPEELVVEESADTPEPDDEPAEHTEAGEEADQGAYDVFDPGGMRWRL